MHKTDTLGKTDRLKSLIRIENLFNTGRSFMSFPFVVYYTVGCKFDNGNCQMMVSVSKHLFKHAVDRNRIKRLTREAYRLRRHRLDAGGVIFSIALVYKSRKIESFETVSQAMEGIVDRFLLILSQHTPVE
ncbi:MAG: ribonuclease P protein component [Bacteroidales bacterium]|nr:ribonuclease P protein component [Bacteroidales bacterium]